MSTRPVGRAEAICGGVVTVLVTLASEHNGWNDRVGERAKLEDAYWPGSIGMLHVFCLLFIAKENTGTVP